MTENSESAADAATDDRGGAQPKHAAHTSADNPVADWCKATAVRAVKTAAQTLLAMVGTGMVGILDVDWANCMSVTLMATVLSVVTSIAGLPEVDGGSSVAKLGKA